MLTPPAPAAAPVVSPARRAWPSVARTLDVVSLTALLLTAFFLASVPARNGDLFGALAAGRDGTFGPHWLFDRVAYLTDWAAGPAALVALKAVALAAFVGLTVWAAARAGAPRRLAIYCGLPAALAVAPFAAVAPAALAPLFFSALLVLVLPYALRGAPPPPRAWLAVLLTAAWTVSAEYALLGPVTIAALALPAGGPGRRRWALVCGAAFLAAFARPDPLGALALPGLTAPTVSAVFRGEGWAALGSPLSRAFWRPHLGYGPAGAALLITALAPLSVLAGRGARRPLGPILLWLMSLAAALAHWAAIPLAATAAAVLIGASAPAGARELTGRGSALAAGLLSVLWTITLPVAAWAGWLQPPPYATRAWRAEPDPSLREVAETLAGWHRDGTWPGEARAAVLHPEAGDQLAWFCPAQHPTLTSDRLAARTARPDNETVAGALTDPRPEWGDVERDALRRLGATHLVLFHPDGGRFNRALTALLNRPGEFPPLLWRGRVLVFGWRDPARGGGADPFPSVRLDLSPNSADPDWHVPAPEAGPAVGPRPFTWRDVLSRPRPPRTADRDEASVALAIFEHQRQRAEAAAPSRYEAQQVAALIGAAAVGPAMTQVGVRAQLAFPGLGQDPQTGRPATPFVGVGLRYRQADLAARGAGPAGTLFRGVRAGRRAVAANPEDAAAWQALGECYLRLRRGTVERAWGDAFPALARVRAAQAAFACRQAVRLAPDSMAAHATLADLFRELNFVDAALDHTQALARLRRAAGPAGGETAEQFEQRVKFLDDEAGRLEAAVRAGESALADYRPANPADRAAAALNRGLARQALQILLDSDVAAFGDEGVMLELGLLLDLGRADEARDWLTKDYRGRFGPERYHLFRAQAAAAVGDYRAADDELGRAAASTDPVGVDRLIALQVSRMLADELVSDIHPVSRVFREINQSVRLDQVLRAGAELRAQWDLAVQRAWLRFEAGDPAAAAAVADALGAAGPFPFPMRRPAEDMARVIRGDR